MSKREKCTYEEKIKAVEDYLNGVRSQKQIAADLGLGKRGRSTVGRWVRRYLSNTRYQRIKGYLRFGR